jgi:hypothetical protein
MFGTMGGGRGFKAIWIATARLGASVLAVGGLPTSSLSQPSPKPLAAAPRLEVCDPIVSREGRLVMQQWALVGNCARPARTRVTDRYLGYVCTDRSPKSTACRAFMAPPESRKFDTSAVFRCVDIAVAPTETGIVISRLREWVPPTKDCDWSNSIGLPMMEVDFASGEVCTAGLCITADRLLAVGKLRLQRLIAKALREFNIAAQATSPY